MKKYYVCAALQNPPERSLFYVSLYTITSLDGYDLIQFFEKQTRETYLPDENNKNVVIVFFKEMN